LFYSLSPHLGKLYISADGKFRPRDVMVRTYVFSIPVPSIHAPRSRTGWKYA